MFEAVMAKAKQHYSLWGRPLILLSLIFILLHSLASNYQFHSSIRINVDSSSSSLLPQKQQQRQQETSPKQKEKEEIDDVNCPWRNSKLYKSIYVYPTYNDTKNGWGNPNIMASSFRNNNNRIKEWPWLEIDQRTKTEGIGHYEIGSQMNQYSLELIIRDILTHPKSCLRSYDPETAALFYIPYLPSMEFHNGRLFAKDYSTSPYANAIEQALQGNYIPWEQLFGWTSKYWIRRSGSDHILVFSEPLHGLSHPRNKRGNHHYIHTQKQLDPPIVVSVEVSTTFVKMYPMCSSKNILMPYPNTDGRWFNGKIHNQTLVQWHQGYNQLNQPQQEQQHQQEQQEEQEEDDNEHSDSTMLFSSAHNKPLLQYYSAGNHGTCAKLRTTMQNDYRCTSSYQLMSSSSTNNNKNPILSYSHGMRLSQFCPCPGGDSPSAKRMFDAIFSGCIPIILSEDYVWPFTKEADIYESYDPLDFSLRWNAKDYERPIYNDQCQRLDYNDDSILSMDEQLLNMTNKQQQNQKQKIQLLRQGLKKASLLYSFYSWNVHGVDNPLREGILPDGGASYGFIKALEDRVYGNRWESCEKELKEIAKQRGSGEEEPRQFKC